VRFAYYRRLSRRDKAIYRESDEWGAIELDDPAALRPLADALGEALRADDRIAAEKGAQRLVRGICRQMGVPPASTRVLAERPRSASAELHGLYVREEGERPVILVWMRTAARERPVAHRTFLRTLMHEVCHHLDYELLELADSFHTHGFFQRESSLVRQLLPKRRAPRAPSPGETDGAAPRQLELPL
jgi:hypothetical protein